MKSLVALLTVVGLAFALYKVNFPTYSYRYRLQLSIEVDGRPHTGSSVIQVNWRCSPRIADSGGCAATLAGQATVVDLGPKGLLVATLRTGDQVSPAADAAVDAVFLCAKAFGNRSTKEELPTVALLRGRRELSRKNLPRLLWFAEPANPSSAKQVNIKNLTEMIGTSAELKQAFVEITSDPIVINIGDELPWYRALELAQKGRPISGRTGQFQLIYNMFVGEDS